MCGTDCQNQRFQKHNYAKVDVIHTEKKGYGLRALSSISAGTFVYEYIGEVIAETKFRKRALFYEQSGVKHFYFMMLQKGEFIDATAKGCLARFCNHSCNPNCYVDKWVVGDKLKMGIFSKRLITPGEEITFDYNVDRYGSEAQPCYCGEANCIGFLGGKTQTEAASKLPQLLVEALELDASDEDKWVATTKRKRKKKTDEELDEDYGESLPTKPITVASVSKVMSSLLQCREQWLIVKLISRISNTTDNAIHARVMQMHGYQIFASLLRYWKCNQHIVVQILQILTQWPKLTKNKISSSKIESTVQELANESEFDDVKELAKGLLSEWSSLEMAYRIPRRERVKTEEPPTSTASDANSDHSASNSVRGMPSDRSNGNTGKKDKKHGWNQPNSDQHDDKNNIFKSSSSSTYNNSFKISKQTTFNAEGIPTGPANKRKSNGTNKQVAANKPLPPNWFMAETPAGKIYYYNKETKQTMWTEPTYDDRNPDHSKTAGTGGSMDNNALRAVEELARATSQGVLDTEMLQRVSQEETLQKIIEEASRIQDQRKAALLQEQEKEEQRRRERAKKHSSNHGASSSTSSRNKHDDKEKRKHSSSQSSSHSHSKEKHTNGSPSNIASTTGAGTGSKFDSKLSHKLTKTFAKHVPNVVATYNLDKDDTKRYSKEIVQLLVEKEMRRGEGHDTSISASTEDMTPEKKIKVRKFVKYYMDKVVERLKNVEEGKARRSSNSHASGSRGHGHSNGSADKLHKQHKQHRKRSRHEAESDSVGGDGDDGDEGQQKQKPKQDNEGDAVKNGQSSSKRASLDVGQGQPVPEVPKAALVATANIAPVEVEMADAEIDFE